MKLIGLSGTNGSGKDTIAHLLRDVYGWYFAGASEMLAEELIKRGEPLERVNKSALSAEWRRQYGMSAVVDKGIELCKADGGSYNGLIVGSLRHPGEADKIHEQGGVVIWVDADPKVRYSRITSANRGRVEDQKTFEQFLAEQAAEMKPSGDAATLNIGAVKELSDVFINNDGNDIEAFKKQIVTTLTEAGLL
jgi:dephospho-CoA kinase